jgi:hypothetical protein
VQDFQDGAELVTAPHPDEEPEGIDAIHAPYELKIASIVVYHIERLV